MRWNRNGVTAGCWREFIDSRLIGCVRKFNLSRLRIFTVFFSPGSALMPNIALKVRKVCRRFWSNLKAASCRLARGDRACFVRGVLNTVQNGSSAFFFFGGAVGGG